MRIACRRRAMTLIELLVVMAVLGVLAGFLFPAVQSIRESARQTACLNQLRQFAIAMHSCRAAHRTYPQSYAALAGVATPVPDQWSVRARILPFVEEDSLHRLCDFTQPYSTQLNVAATRIGLFLCPSEINDTVRLNAAGTPRDYPANYAVNMGTWKIWDPNDGSIGDGAFHVNSRFATHHFQDGESHTLMAAEVKAYTPYLRNSVQDPGPTVPSSPSFASGFTAASGDTLMGPNLMDNTGQTEWADGLCQQSGFTTTFVPNTRVPYVRNGIEYDIDYVSWREGTHASRTAWASITARSYHPGLVNIATMNGSVRPVADGVDLAVWRAMGTRAGRELDRLAD
jgi:prepilin-type N-terminal cleavage/methylation domain-containing protein